MRSRFAAAIVLMLLVAAYASCVGIAFATEAHCCDKYIPERPPIPVHVEHELNRDGLLAALTGGVVYLLVNRHRHHHRQPAAPTCEDRVERVMRSCQAK